MSQPIKVTTDDADRPSCPHTKAERALFPHAASRKLLSRCATYLRGDKRALFGHATQDAAFGSQINHADLINLLGVADSKGMAAFLTDIGDKCADQTSSNRRLLAKVIGVFATDGPIVLYLPCGVAESLLTFSSTV